MGLRQKAPEVQIRLCFYYLFQTNLICIYTYFWIVHESNVLFEVDISGGHATREERREV